MERLREKGFLRRAQVDGVYRYSPSQPKAELLGGLIRDFVETALGGSLSPFMAYLSREAELSDAELEELRGILRKHEPPEGEESAR
jgi:predicted transcriptional regulator